MSLPFEKDLNEHSIQVNESLWTLVRLMAELFRLRTYRTTNNYKPILMVPQILQVEFLSQDHLNAELEVTYKRGGVSLRSNNEIDAIHGRVLFQHAVTHSGIDYNETMDITHKAQCRLFSSIEVLFHNAINYKYWK